MYYTKREYNSMKNALTKENKDLKKQVAKLKAKIEELKYANEVTFEPDFALNPTSEETQENDNISPESLNPRDISPDNL